MEKARRIILDFDDLHWSAPENCLDTIQRLVAEVPTVKMNFFTVPKLRNRPLSQNNWWCREIRKYIDSGHVMLSVHGLLHDHLEFESIAQPLAKQKIKEGLKLFEEAELPVHRIFKGPNWGINAATVRALAELEFEGLFTHPTIHADLVPLIEELGMWARPYDLNLADSIDSAPDKKEIITHGHTHNVCSNGILQVAHKIRDLANNPKYTFAFIGED